MDVKLEKTYNLKLDSKELETIKECLKAGKIVYNKDSYTYEKSKELLKQLEELK